MLEILLNSLIFLVKTYLGEKFLVSTMDSRKDRKIENIVDFFNYWNAGRVFLPCVVLIKTIKQRLKKWGLQNFVSSDF